MPTALMISVASVARPPQPAMNPLIDITIRVGSGRASPGPSRPRKICSNCGMTTIMMIAIAPIATMMTAAG